MRRDRADGHRHVGQRLVAARRGDDDFAGIDRLLLDGLILRRRPLGRAGVGWAACLSVSVLETAVWANAGVVSETRPAEISHADLRIMSLSPAGASARSAERLMPIGKREAIASAQRCNPAALKQFGNSSVSSAARPQLRSA